MRPITASAALRQMSPRKLAAANLYPPLRIHSSRDISPARPRSGSIKRKSDDSFSYAAVVNASNNQAAAAPPFFRDPEKLEKMNVEIAKVTSLSEKISGAVNAISEDDPVRAVLLDISEAIKLLNNNQAEIIKEHTQPTAAAAAVNTGNIQNANMVSLGTVPKRNRVSELSEESSRFQYPAAAYPPPSGTGSQ
jgi:DNA-binding FrmR family transcriptional regulator